MYPLKTPKVSCGYGVEGDHWKLGRHNGVDFKAAIGTPVYAVAPCRVVEVGKTSWGEAYGDRSVIVYFRNGQMAIYAHLDKAVVTKNQQLAEGDLIGKVGNRGNSTGPHLHFETRVEPHKYGEDVDPTYLFESEPFKASLPALADKPKKKAVKKSAKNPNN